MPWFFGSISRLEAEKFLSNHGKVGAFLIRNAAASGAEDVCLSVLAPEGGPRFRHLLVVHNDASLYKISSLPAESEAFSSLTELVEFYSKNQIHFQDSGPSVTLVKPCM